MPPGFTDGVTGFACSAPPIFCVPSSGGTSSAASTVITTWGLAFRGCQVALQRPSFREPSGSEGSPSENDAVTFPAVMKFPQSSTMVTSMGVGHAATVVKFDPSCVNTGMSLVAAHVDAAAASVLL